MDRRARQLRLVATGEGVDLPPDVARRAVKAMGRMVLQRLWIEEERGKGDHDDSRR